ncbi:MAG: 16S rRNA (guanine(527)-N(7))-methyltransferase RsmG [Cyanobacteria bacterium P01_F01_bin.150]
MTTDQDPSSSATSSPVHLPHHSDHWLRTLNWSPSDRQQQQFQVLYQKVCEGNRSVNLTRIIEPDDFWEKHLWDSLSGVKPFLQTEETPAYRVLDIGSGAGFPGLPIAIAFPHWSITLLDSTRKKMAFVQNTLADIGLANVRTVVERAETLGRDSQHRHRYNLVTIRAVAAAAACAEYALPFLKIEGKAILYRGRWAEFELTDLKKALKKLGGEVEDIQALSTPLSGGDRHCIVIRKTAKTPKAYPRAVGIPAKTPLS